MNYLKNIYSSYSKLLLSQFVVLLVSLPLAYVSVLFIDSDSAKEAIFYAIVVCVGLLSLLICIKTVSVFIHLMKDKLFGRREFFFLLGALVICFVSYWVIVIDGLLLFGFS